MYNIIYKVLWLGRPEVGVTWEPASSLSPQLIKEFEDGIACDVVETMSTSCGQHTSTLAVQRQRHTAPPIKKQKHNRPILESNTGYSSKISHHKIALGHTNLIP